MILTQKQINIIVQDATNLSNPTQDDDCPNWLKYYHKIRNELVSLNNNNLLDLGNIEEQMNISLSNNTKKQIKCWVNLKCV